MIVLAAKPDQFDPDALRIMEGDPLKDHAASMVEPLVTQVPPRPKRRKFAMPELEPGSWFIRAQEAFGPQFSAGATVALYLIMKLGIQGGDCNRPMRVSNQHLKTLGVNRFAKYRALDALKKAGLIQIQPSTRSRQAPVVVLKNYLSSSPANIDPGVGMGG